MELKVLIISELETTIRGCRDYSVARTKINGKTEGENSFRAKMNGKIYNIAAYTRFSDNPIARFFGLKNRNYNSGNQTHSNGEN
jgi:hypothetical protein